MLRRSWSRWLINVSMLALLFAVGFLAIAFEALPIEWPLAHRFAVGFRSWSADPASSEHIKKFGFAVSAISVVIGLYRAWRYFEDHLPRRFEEYLIASGKETLRDRDLLLAEVRGIATDGGAANWLERIGRWSERRRLERYIAEIEAGASSQQGEFARLQRSHKLASTAIEVRSRELATAHFIRAELHAKAAADRQVLAGDASEALASFREAARLDKSDWRIHRAYAEQMGKTNQLNDDVLSAVEGWREAANQSGNRREEAMALRRLGEVHFKRSGDPGLLGKLQKERRDEAIIALDGAISLMQDNPPAGVAAGRDLASASCLELLGDVRIKSVTMTIARQKLMAAREIYSAVDDAEAVGRVDIKLKRMNSEDSDSESSASQQ